MRVLAYPADAYGCGHHRVTWPGLTLRAAGHAVTVVQPRDRHLVMRVDDAADRVVDVEAPEDVDVVVLQRVTHRYLAQAVSVLRDRGVAVVVDVDDDLAAVHPRNPAWRDLHPRRDRLVTSATPHLHSWHHLSEACRAATLVTATTPTLLRRYAGHGRGRLLPNYLAEHYYDVPRVDSDVLGWPAALSSHPDDPSALGNAVARLIDEGASFAAPTAATAELPRAFGFVDDARVRYLDAAVGLYDWPRYLATLGVGVAPLADTRFNAAKSWLKPLELAAVGVPWVASPRVEYARLHALGCGVLAEKPKTWYRELRRLLDDPSRRAELSDAGRAVAATLRLRDHAWRWWEAWNDALALERGARRASAIVVG